MKIREGEFHLHTQHATRTFLERCAYPPPSLASMCSFYRAGFMKQAEGGGVGTLGGRSLWGKRVASDPIYMFALCQRCCVKRDCNP